MQLAWVPRAAAQDFSSGPELKQNEKELWFWGGPRQNCVAANLFHVWPWEMSLLIIIYLMYDTFTWILKRLLSFLLEKHQYAVSVVANKDAPRSKRTPNNR